MEQSKEHSCGVLEKVPLMKKMKSKAVADLRGKNKIGIIVVLKEGQSKWKLETRVLNKQKILSILRTCLVKFRHLKE